MSSNVSQNCEISLHSHSTVDGNLMMCGVKIEKVKNRLGMIVGFRKIKAYRCRICTREIEEVDSEITLLKS